MANSVQPVLIHGRAIYFEMDDGDGPALKSAPHLREDGEITPTSSAGRAASPELLTPSAAADLQSTLDALLDPVRAAASGKKLQEVTVEVSLGLKAELGFFVAKGETNASLKVIAKWKPAD